MSSAEIIPSSTIFSFQRAAYCFPGRSGGGLIGWTQRKVEGTRHDEEANKQYFGVKKDIAGVLCVVAVCSCAASG